jgi:hypothetical protein
VEVKALAVWNEKSTFDEEAVDSSGRARGISFHLFIIASDMVDLKMWLQWLSSH